MRFPRPLARVALAAGLSLAASCSVQDDKSPYFGTTERVGKDVHTFYVNNASEPEYLDPGKAHDSVSTKLIYHLFEGLASYGPDAQPVPGVATSWDRSPDNLYFRFHLRDDAKWSDGKPVTAQDFEYAWKRVLTPETGSQSSTNLYFVRNGELFNQGKLLVASADTDVSDAPSGGKVVAKLAKGDIALVLARSPVTVEAEVPPFDALPEGAPALGYDAANPKKKVAEKLVLIHERTSDTIAPDPARRLPAGDYDVTAMLAPVVCNGEKDHYFQLVARDGSGKKAILPGCMLKPSKAKEQQLFVAPFRARPTFDPKTRAPREEEPAPIGFVAEGALASDSSILGVRAVDDRTLEVEAEFPTPYVLDMLCAATTYPVRRDVVEPFEKRGEPDLWTRPESIVTNGPYRISSWKFRYEIRMQRAPYHRYHDKLKIHEIVWMAVESYVSNMNLYKTGELDYIGDNAALPPAYLPILRAKKDFEITPYLSTYWYELNTKVPPLDDARVRKALNLAIDKQTLIDRITRGGQTPATHFVPDAMGGGYSERVQAERDAGADPFASPEVGFNPERARELLGQAGFPVEKSGEGYIAKGMPPVELLYNTSEAHRAVAVAIQDMWKSNLGISVQLRNEEWHVMLKNVRDKNFQVVRFGWVADYDHPQTYMDTFTAKSPNNRTGWSNARFDELVSKARATADTAESMKLYREAEAILVDEVPKIPLYFYTKSTLIKPWVKGFHFNRRNEQLAQWMWIDPDWRTHEGDEPAMDVPSFPASGAY